MWPEVRSAYLQLLGIPLFKGPEIRATLQAACRAKFALCSVSIIKLHIPLRAQSLYNLHATEPLQDRSLF